MKFEIGSFENDGFRIDIPAFFSLLRLFENMIIFFSDIGCVMVDKHIDALFDRKELINAVHKICNVV